MRTNELRKSDIEHVWHPYTDIDGFAKKDFPIYEKADGVYLFEKDGSKHYDGISSWWCVNLGHSHPRLIKAIKNQADKMQHVILGGVSHEPIIKLSESLANITPDGLNHCFFCSDGSSSIEASLKMSIQYWGNKGKSEKTKFISLESGYHGDTLGAIGVGYVKKFHNRFDNAIVNANRASSPNCSECSEIRTSCSASCFNSMEKLIEEYHSETAAVIVEPLCQGAAGIRIYSKKYLQKLRKACDKYGLLLIADEIAVGFGRTGEWFACDYAGITPDILVAGKGLTGGYLPMSVAITTDKIYDSYRSTTGKDNTFYHGHTFSGNPIIAALASEAIQVYKDEKIFSKLTEKIQLLAKGMEQISKKLTNSYSDSLGMIGMIRISEKDGGETRASEITEKARANGLLIRPLGPVLYLWPPLTSTAKELEDMISIFLSAID